MGKKPSSARATALRGAKKEEATFIPPIETKVPVVTTAFATGPKNLAAASATGASLSVSPSPKIPMATT